uniref:Uncharacterized protein n=1 Tax=Lotus japonicus TaxID=34305 RepID=I3T4X8_LOTJA|nr:unknown [Lotus japonicus]
MCAGASLDSDIYGLWTKVIFFPSVSVSVLFFNFFLVLLDSVFVLMSCGNESVNLMVSR